MMFGSHTLFNVLVLLGTSIFESGYSKSSFILGILYMQTGRLIYIPDANQD